MTSRADELDQMIERLIAVLEPLLARCDDRDFSRGPEHYAQTDLLEEANGYLAESRKLLEGLYAKHGLGLEWPPIRPRSR